MVEPETKEDHTQPGPSWTFLERWNFTLPSLRAHCIFWLVVVCALVLDLWSKRTVFDLLKEKHSISVIPGFVQFVLAENPGAAFGIAAGQYHLLLIISVVALIVIFAIFLFGGNQKPIVYIALGMFAAGVCGNLWDRAFNEGCVRDFIDVVYWPGKHWPAFNVADAMLCVGVGLLIISTLFTGRSYQKRAQKHK